MSFTHHFRVVCPWYGNYFAAPPYGAKNLEVLSRLLENLWKERKYTLSVILLLQFKCIKEYTTKNFNCDLNFPQF